MSMLVRIVVSNDVDTRSRSLDFPVGQSYTIRITFQIFVQSVLTAAQWSDDFKIEDIVSELRVSRTEGSFIVFRTEGEWMTAGLWSSSVSEYPDVYLGASYSNERSKVDFIQDTPIWARCSCSTDDESHEDVHRAPYLDPNVDAQFASAGVVHCLPIVLYRDCRIIPELLSS